MKHIPKGSMCVACEHAGDDCSHIDFSEMMPLKKYEDGTVAVKCCAFVPWPTRLPPLQQIKEIENE